MPPRYGGQHPGGVTGDKDHRAGRGVPVAADASVLNPRGKVKVFHEILRENQNQKRDDRGKKYPQPGAAGRVPDPLT